MTKIKICGITRERETEWLNELNVDYVGFVFYEKSRRNVDFNTAKLLMNRLDPHIKKAAVTVSPDERLIQCIVEAGFDILQVHGKADEELLEKCPIPIWRAMNLSSVEELQQGFIEEAGRYAGILLDAGEFGSGRTFGWEMEQQVSFHEELPWQQGRRAQDAKGHIDLILAGGLHAGNVAEGMRLFAPDAVDVSSGVEAPEMGPGKSREKMEAFVAAVRSADAQIQQR